MRKTATKRIVSLVATKVGVGALALGPLWGCGSSKKDGVASWTVQSNGIACTHPAVQESCSDGWCEIPAGCFIKGSPETEPGHAASGEELTAVTFSRGFYIQQTEVTQGQWAGLVGNNPTTLLTVDYAKACIADDCPVGVISWQEMLAFANLMSKRDGYPECYELVGCTGELGKANYACTDVKLTTATVYDCQGYRLPTEAEWEYAARAGTRTTFYSGDLTEAYVDITPDVKVPVLESIAWYCANSGNSTHPVGQKKPNAWGLYDMIGNAGDATSWLQAEPDPAGPLTDPQATLGRFGGTEGFYQWIVKGAYANAAAVWMRTASEAQNTPWTYRGVLSGFRLVRTKPKE